MGRIIAIMIIVVGGIIAFIGFNADRLFGGSPGISTPQMMIIVSGIVLALTGIILMIDKIRQQISQNALKVLGISIPTILILSVMLEIMLAFAGFGTTYPTEPVPEWFGEPADWWICDELGCHFKPIARARICEQFPQGRSCDLNAQGFHDEDDFSQSSALDDASLRILMLGDSFTFGGSATNGNSFVEILEAQIPEAMIWNVSMPGAGTNQQAMWLEAFTPIMQPDLVIVGFFMNDFEDNGYPVDSYFWGISPDGQRLAIRKYRLDENNTPILVDSPEELFYRAYGTSYPQNPIIRLAGKTRVGSLIVNTWLSIQRTQTRQEGSRWEYLLQSTRDDLLQLQSYAEAEGIPLIMLGIPAYEDVTQNSGLATYQSALELFEEVGLDVLDPLYLLSADSYNPPDVHWNNQGHGVVGQQLVACVEAFDASRDLADCIEAFGTSIVSN